MRSSPPGPRLLEELLGADRVEDAADAEPRHVAGGLRGRAPPLLDPVDHLLDEVVGDHAVAGHGAQATHLYSSILMSVLPPRRYTTDRGSDLSTFALNSWR